MKNNNPQCCTVVQTVCLLQFAWCDYISKYVGAEKQVLNGERTWGKEEGTYCG